MSRFASVCVLAVLVVCASAAPVADVNEGANGIWSVISQTGLTTELCVAFESDQVGWVAGDGNGVGPEILRTTDGGKTWNQTEAKFGIDILLLACAANKKAVVVSSVGGELFSEDDGKTFKPSYGGGISQSVRAVKVAGVERAEFGVAGQFGSKQGVAVSTVGGAVFKRYTTDVLFTLSRYASFPTDDVWYISAGEFPNPPPPPPPSGDEDERPVHHKRPRSEFIDHKGKAIWRKEFGSGLNDDGYNAQVVKTTDGGQTWTSVFANNGSYYNNGIDCTSATHCCFVAEASDSSAAGARIFCTFDGGSSWNQTFYAPSTSKEGFSLIDIRFATETFGWAVGGDLNVIEPKAWFLETNDGGKTWDAQKHELPGFYALGLDVLSDSSAFAAVDNLITQQSALAKFTTVSKK